MDKREQPKIPTAENRRERRDRRENNRRLDERRKAGIGEIIPERRMGPRREPERRGPENRRDRRD